MVWCCSFVRRLSVRVSHLAAVLNASNQSFPVDGAIFRFVDEVMRAFIHFRNFAFCNHFQSCFSYFISFRCELFSFFPWLFVVFVLGYFFRALHLLGPPFLISCIPPFFEHSQSLCHVLTVHSIYQDDSQPDDSTAGAGPSCCGS